jgi:uncharacterized protein (DUF4415 family)
MSEDATKYRTSDGSSLTPSEITRLDAVETSLGESDDIPETSDAAWASSVRGRHAKAMEAAISIRLDAEVLAWLRAKGPGYGTEINRILREKMLSEA